MIGKNYLLKENLTIDNEIFEMSSQLDILFFKLTTTVSPSRQEHYSLAVFLKYIPFDYGRYT